MLVHDYMTVYPQTLNINATLKDAAQLFFKYKINGVPIISDNGEICGLITTSHLIRAIINDTSFTQPVSAVMTNNVITVGPDTSLEEACQIPVSRLPVVSADNKIIGMLTQRDFVSAFFLQLQRATDEGKAFIRSAHNGIIVINAYGIITTFNETAARLTGVLVADAIGKPIEEVAADSGLRRVLTTGKSETGCHLRINGQTFFSNRSPICEGPKIVGALAIIQDTSNLQEIALQLSVTQHRAEALEDVFESARQGIVVVNEKGIVTHVNKSYENIFCVSRDKLIGCPAVEAIENTRLHIVVRTGIPELGEIQNYQGRQVIVNRIPLFRDGRICGAIGEAIFKDINEVNLLLEKLHLLERQVSRFQSKLKECGEHNRAEYTFDNIIGSSRLLVQAKNLAAKAAHSNSNVLILGESGTGKELFAHSIHNASHRRGMPFVAVNCAAIPVDLLESELFGYEEGAFTGAKKGGKKGKFELADTGTLFLDEIGDMPLAMQAKILRVLENKCLEKVGSNLTVHCDVRIIAATNRQLSRMVQEHSFREDLFYRLNVIRLQIPPLRERREEIGELVQHLLPGICRNLGVPPKEFDAEAMALLREYQWPGNVRELN